MCREVDFARAAGQNVSSHEFLPKGANMLIPISRAKQVRIGRSVALSVHGEFERLQTVVLRHESHKRAERVRWLCGVGENVS